MPFFGPSYTGQGIVQATERDRSGEILAQGFAGLGAGIGKGIAKGQARKSEAKVLRAKLKGFGAEFDMEEGEWAPFLEDQNVDELRGLGENLIMKQAMQLHKAKLSAYQQEADTAKQAREAKEQSGRAIQGILQSNIPGNVDVPRQDFTGQIGKAKEEEGRLSGLMRFAQKPEGSMPTDESLRQIQQRPSESGKSEFDPTYAQFVRENVAPEGQRNQYQKQAAQSAGLINEKYAQSMAGKAAQAREALGQLDEEVSKPLGDIRNQIKILEEKQGFEDRKPGTRPETAEEFSKRRSGTLKKLIEDNPLAAGTIYSALMGTKVDPPKLDSEARKAVGFADRMQNAEGELKQVFDSFNPAGTFEGVKSMLPNIMKSEGRQQYEALALDWITANLRRESGAAIGEKEYENDFKKYFPMPGDSANTIKLKESLRQQAVESTIGPIQSSYPTLNMQGFQGATQSGQTFNFNPSTGELD